MKRSHLIYGIVYTCIGVAFLLLALFTEYRLESLFWGLAGGMGFSGIQMIVRYVYWSAPGRREIYAQRMEQERIELHDELKEKIFSGEIEVAKTVASLMAYAVKYGR